MSRTLTAQDRASLIRLASSLPAGSPQKRSILSSLRVANAGYEYRLYMAEKEYIKDLVEVFEKSLGVKFRDVSGGTIYKFELKGVEYSVRFETYNFEGIRFRLTNSDNGKEATDKASGSIRPSDFSNDILRMLEKVA